jgi:choice-of-anchor B domain-containing protein
MNRLRRALRLVVLVSSAAALMLTGGSGAANALGGVGQSDDAELAAAPAGAQARQNPPAQAQPPRRFAPCIRGTAFVPELEGHPILQTGAFPCDRVDLMSFFTNDEIGGGLEVGTGRGSDVWGWTDPLTRREYVIAGLENGTSFIDISDPKRPIFLAHLPTSSAQNLIWRDIKVYADHAFIVSESSGHGMQVFDLTGLRDIDRDAAPVTVDETAHYDGFQRAHNIVLNEDSGFAFAVDQREDAEGCGRGMHMIDVREPANPSFAGCYDETRVHDAHCVTYDGADTRFTAREICITSTGSDPTVGQSVGVVDVTDKDNPLTLSVTGYPNSVFSHQGWLLDGHRFYVHGSETGGDRNPQGVDIFDMADLTGPQHIGFFESPAQSTHHNLYQKNRYVFQSNYSSGLRVYDSRNVADGELEEVAFFDVYPPDNNAGFGFGTWSNYPWFKSGVIAVHGYQGLWLVKPRLGNR